MPHESEAQLREILSLETIAVVGASTTPGKAAHTVPRYLQEQGYTIIPVNPNHDQVLGERSYPSLAAVEKPIDIVNVFRPPEELPEIVAAVIERDDVCVLWTQLGIVNEAATTRAEDAGITVVQDMCIREQHKRLDHLLDVGNEALNGRGC